MPRRPLSSSTFVLFMDLCISFIKKLCFEGVFEDQQKSPWAAVTCRSLCIGLRPRVQVRGEMQPREANEKSSVAHGDDLGLEPRILDPASWSMLARGGKGVNHINNRSGGSHAL